MALNVEQGNALQICIAGHNLAILGQAGVGKTHLLRIVTEELRRRGNRVAVTCTTGVACSNFTDATTIHHFSGIKDGRYSLKELQHRMSDEVFTRTKTAIRSTDVLIIDEISMLSYKSLCQIEAVCRMVMEETLVFGGIQVIVSGDFFQLPPVPNHLYGDPGDFAFSGPIWQNIFPHHVVLTNVLRQNEARLINAIRETSKGQMTEDTVAFLKSLCQPLGHCDKHKTIKLFATNQQVDIQNQKELMKIPGDLKVFKSDDVGDSRYLNRMKVPRILWLKEGCLVVLLKNLSDKLVNGLMGNVTEIGADCVHVFFPSINLSTNVNRFTFSVYDPNLRANVAERTQFPLKLGYALTVHKSQGMTIERLEVDCEGIFKAGQLGVAIGRVKSVDGLRVVHFHTRAVMPQDDIIFEFYEKPSLPVEKNLQCCRHTSLAQMDLESTITGGDELYMFEDDDVDLIGAYDEVMDNTHTDEESDDSDDDSEESVANVSLDQTLNLLCSSRCKAEVTSLQKEINKNIDQLSATPPTTVRLCCHFYNVLLKFYSQTIHVDTKNQSVTEFYKKCHNYLVSKKYKLKVQRLFESTGEAEYQIAFNLFIKIREQLLKEKSDDSIQPESSNLSDFNKRVNYQDIALPDGARAKIRYVAGYCFHKLHKRSQTKLKENIFKLTKQSLDILETESRKLKILQSALKPQNVIISETEDMESLKDVMRKQNVREGLTHISDQAYTFCVKLCRKCLMLQTEKNLHTFGRYIHEYVSSTLKDDISLYEEWLAIFTRTTYLETDTETSDAALDCLQRVVNFSADISCVYESFVEIFTRVMSKQFIKDIVQFWNVEKKEAHRKEVMRKKEKINVLTLKAIQEDKSTDKKYSKYSLKAMVLRNKDLLKEYTLVQLKTIGKLYGVNITKKLKCDVMNQVETVIKNYEETTTDTSPSTSGELSSTSSQTDVRKSTSEKRATTSKRSRSTSRGKGKGRGKKLKNPCGMCGEDCIVECVACDGCDMWYHATCVNVLDLVNLPDQWFCQQCEEALEVSD